MPEPAKSSTWLRKGWETLSQIGRAPSSVAPDGSPNVLRNLFADLMAYVLLFEASCGQQSPSITELRERILALINAQEERVKSGEASPESYREARFAVLSWVDETILNSPWPYRNQWQHLMLTFYKTLNAGEEFFRRLEAIPSHANDIREIYYLCVSLGFQGKYAFGDNLNEIRELKHGLYRQLCDSAGDVRQSYRRLFPEAYQAAPGTKPSTLPKVRPLWFALAILLPILLFVSYWFLLRRETNRLLALIEQPPVVVSKPPQIEWTRTLVEELRARGIDAQETQRGILVTLGGLLFEANRAELHPEAVTKIADLASAIKRHAPERMVFVEGHASRERGVPEERNQRLSEDRAKTVGDALVRYGLLSGKVTTRGFGSVRPVGSNETEPGRRANRRVEILIER